MNGTAFRAYCLARAALVAACAPALAGCFYEEYEVTAPTEGCEKVGTVDPIACRQAKPVAIAADAENVYWTNVGSGEIMAMSKASGAVSALVTVEDEPCGIVAIERDARLNIFWRTRAGAVWRMDLTDRIPETVESGLGDSCLIAVDTTSVYYFRRDEDNAHHLRRSVFKGMALDIATTNRPHALAVSTIDAVVWIDAAEKKAYSKPKAPDGQLRDLGVNDPCGIDVRGQRAFITSMARGEITVADVNGLIAPEGTLENQPTPCLVTSAEGAFYWLSDGGGTLTKKTLPLLGAPSVLATGPTAPCAITTDSQYVYWTTCDNHGLIMRAPL